MSSILQDTKRPLMIPDGYSDFDADIMLHINAAFATLSQVGVPLPDGFVVTDDSAEWENVSSNTELMSLIKQYIYLKVRVGFDPPTSSFVLSSFEELAKELTSRISYMVDPAQ